MKKIETTRFGQVEVADESLITFREGIPAFEDEHEFAVMPYDENGTYMFLQSTKTPELAFLMTNPFFFFPDYTFEIDEERSDSPATSTLLGAEATTGKSVDYQGIPYYMAQMNEWIRSFSQAVNDILCSGYGSNGDEGCNLFTGDMPTEDDQFDLPDGDYGTKDNAYYKWTNGGSVSCEDDSYYRITAKNFNVLAALEKNADLLATKKDYGDGVGSSDLINELTQMLGNKDKMSFRNCTAGDFLTCILSDVSLNANAANTFYENYTNIATTIDNQRISISGVDTDEEAMNLVQFQNSYNLASKMIQILTEVYDRLILETGV